MNPHDMKVVLVFHCGNDNRSFTVEVPAPDENVILNLGPRPCPHCSSVDPRVVKHIGFETPPLTPPAESTTQNV